MRPTRTAPTWRLSASATTVAFVLSVCAILIGHEAFRVWSSRDAALRDAQKDTQNLARSLAQHAEDTMRTVDALLISMVERMETGSRDGSALERLRKLFGEETARLPPLRNLAIIDRDGSALVDKFPSTKALNFSDRDYFQHHQAQRDRVMHIGRPIRSRVVGLSLIHI